MKIGIEIGIGRRRRGSIVKLSSGLIFKTDFEDISDWTNDGTFSKVADDALIAFDPLPINFKWTEGGVNEYGVRGAVPYIENNILYLTYGAGNHVDGWGQMYAKSTNNGKTFTKHGFFTTIDQNPVTKTPQVGLGYVWKDGNKYYLYRVVVEGTVNLDPYVLFYVVPYSGDILSADSIEGPWTAIDTIDQYPATWAAIDSLPGCVVKSGSVYYLFLEGHTGDYNWQIGNATSNTPIGPWTLNTTPILNRTILADGRDPENPKVFLHPLLNKWICLANIIAAATTFTDQNAIMISASIDNWSGASLRRIQSINDMDGINCIGQICHYIKPDNDFLIGQNNFVPIMYDHSGLEYTPGWHQKRTISTALLEPSRNVLRFDGSVSGSIYKAQANMDFIIEFGVQFPAYTAGEILSFVYRADGTGANEYILQIQNGGAKLRLIKRVSSSNTTIETGTASQTVTIGMINRIKVVIFDTSHKAYINGQLQINSTDAAIGTGTHLGFSGVSVVDGDVRLISIRTSDTIFINDLPEGIEVELRADGGIVAATSLANANGIATFTLNHWPMESLFVNGKNYFVIGGIWGGDVFSFSKISWPVVTFNPVISATIENAAPANVVLTFQYDLYEESIPDMTDFILTGKTITAISISGAVVTLTVSAAYLFGDIVTINYNRGFGRVLRSLGTTNIKTFTDQVVTNNITVSIYDTFTDTNNVALHDHVMNVGSGWTDGNAFIITSNQAITNQTGGANYKATFEAGISDIDMSIDLIIPNSDYYAGGILARNIDDTHCWMILIQINGAPVPFVALYKLAGGATLIETVNIIHVVGSRTLRVTAINETIIIYLDGTALITYTGAVDYKTETTHGIWVYKDAGNGNIAFDNLLLIAP